MDRPDNTSAGHLRFALLREPSGQVSLSRYINVPLIPRWMRELRLSMVGSWHGGFAAIHGSTIPLSTSVSLTSRVQKFTGNTYIRDWIDEEPRLCSSFLSVSSNNGFNFGSADHLLFLESLAPAPRQGIERYQTKRELRGSRTEADRAQSLAFCP
jgi:hypothetical protein